MKNAARKKSRLATLRPAAVLAGMLFLVATVGFGQKKSDQLQAEQSRLEEKLSNTRNLLEKVQSGTKSSLNEIKLIDNQVKYREELVQNFDNQIRGAELTISSKDAEVKALRKRLERMRSQYKKLLLYAYKHRNRHGKMMYIFSASNYFEAVKRSAYLKRLAEMQRKQFRLIRQSQQTITKEIGQIRSEKQKKEVLLDEKIQEKDKILKDKQEHEKKLAVLRQDEQKLMTQLKADQKQEEMYAPADWKVVVNKTADMMRALGDKPALSEMELKSINIPVKLLLGSEDHMVTREETEAVKALLPNVTFQVVEGWKHPIERVDQAGLASLIFEFSV